MMGDAEDKRVGEWFGPNTIAQVLKYKIVELIFFHRKHSIKKKFFRKLVKYDDWSALNLHVAMDNNIIIKEIGKLIPALLKEISNYLPL